MGSLQRSVRVSLGHDSSPDSHKLKNKSKRIKELFAEQQDHLDVSQQSIGRNQDLTDMRMSWSSSSL